MQRTTVILLAIVAALLLGAALSPSTQVRYHLWRAGALEGSSESVERYQHHCARLVELGYLFQADYDLSHLEGVDGAGGVLRREINRQQLLGLGPGYTQQPSPWGPLTVCGHAGAKAEWDAFVGKINTPDFEEKYAEQLEKFRKDVAAQESGAEEPSFR